MSHPASARVVAMPSPIPLVEPVTTAVLPFNIGSSSSARFRSRGTNLTDAARVANPDRRCGDLLNAARYECKPRAILPVSDALGALCDAKHRFTLIFARILALAPLLD